MGIHSQSGEGDMMVFKNTFIMIVIYRVETEATIERYMNLKFCDDRMQLFNASYMWGA